MDNNKINEALEKRNQADFQAYLKLRELMKMTDYDPGRQKLEKIIAEYNGYDVADAKEFIKEIEQVLEAREQAQEEFIQTIQNARIPVTVKEKNDTNG